MLKQLFSYGLVSKHAVCFLSSRAIDFRFKRSAAQDPLACVFSESCRIHDELLSLPIFIHADDVVRRRRFASPQNALSLCLQTDVFVGSQSDTWRILHDSRVVKNIETGQPTDIQGSLEAYWVIRSLIDQIWVCSLVHVIVQQLQTDNRWRDQITTLKTKTETVALNSETETKRVVGITWWRLCDKYVAVGIIVSLVTYTCGVGRERPRRLK